MSARWVEFRSDDVRLPAQQRAVQSLLPADVEIYADIRQVGTSKSPVQRSRLSFNTAGTPSLFCGSYEVAAGPGPTYYEATVTAHQLRTGNVGAGTVTFFVKAPAAG